MSDNLNYGYVANQMKCNCGRHEGIGPYTAEQRAAIAGRMRDILPDLMSASMREFVASWERFHGNIKYIMGVIGVSSGEFVKQNKGQNIIGPIYIENHFLAHNPIKQLESV